MPEARGTSTFGSFLERCPLIAILRGVTPDEVVPIGRILVEAGFAMLEVPLNSPQPLESIARLASALGPETLVGAGTVIDPASCAAIFAAGGRLIVMPHGDAAVIRTAKALGQFCAPGVATPTEAFAALANGADALKLFPAELLDVPVVKAWRSILPRETSMLPVGGITPEKISAFVTAGAAGFGLGSALYQPGFTPADVAVRARAFIDAWHHSRRGSV